MLYCRMVKVPLFCWLGTGVGEGGGVGGGGLGGGGGEGGVGEVGLPLQHGPCQ